MLKTNTDLQKSPGESFRIAINTFPENSLFLSVCTIILLIPVIATIGQFYTTGFFLKSSPLLIVYWPGSDFGIKIQVLVWVSMGLFFISYLAGIYFLLKKRTLGKVILIVILVFVISNLIRTILTSAFGWQESPLPNLEGKANTLIVSLWHNPIWEEIVFRGIPLLILILTEKYLTKRRTLTGVLIYCIIPSIVCGIYHIPGHGIIRFFDTLIIGSAFAWLALKFTFPAPVVMHYIADAMLVLSLNKLPTIQTVEIEWLIQYGRTLNTFSFLFVLVLFALIPVLFVFYYSKHRKRHKQNS